jgi:hypothetical protein
MYSDLPDLVPVRADGSGRSVIPQGTYANVNNESKRRYEEHKSSTLVNSSCLDDAVPFFACVYGYTKMSFCSRSGRDQTATRTIRLRGSGLRWRSRWVSTQP